MLLLTIISAGGYQILGGLYLGWGIGANNAANIFGTAVATKAVGYRPAVILMALFVLVGALVEGPRVFLSGSASFSAGGGTDLALIATLAAAASINLVTYLSLPTSTSQAAIGAYMGTAIATVGWQAVEWARFIRMMVGWIVSPLVGLILCVFLIKVLGGLVNRFLPDATVRDRVFKVAFLVFGCYAAYTLGANNVVVTTVAYYDAGMFGLAGSQAAARWAAAVGGASMAVGALTYGKKVMETIGKKITPLSPFSALVVVLVHSLTLHFFTWLNIPVSSTHAVVGAVVGVGLLHGVETVNRVTLVKIFLSWVSTPMAAGILAWAVAAVVL